MVAAKISQAGIKNFKCHVKNEHCNPKIVTLQNNIDYILVKL